MSQLVNMKKISRVSRIVQVVLVLYAIIHILLWASSIISPSLSEVSQGTSDAGLFIQHNMEGKESESAQLVAANMNPRLWLTTTDTLFQLSIFYFLYLLFQQYRLGYIYSLVAVNQIKRMGYCFMLWPIFDLCYGPLLIISLKLLGIIEHGELKFSLNNENLEMLAIGLMLTVVGWIIAEGKKLKDEQDLTI